MRIRKASGIRQGAVQVPLHAFRLRPFLGGRKPKDQTARAGGGGEHLPTTPRTRLPVARKRRRVFEREKVAKRDFGEVAASRATGGPPCTRAT